MKPVNLIGQIFGRLTPISPTRKRNRRAWNCSCTCGNIVIVTTSDLTSGKVNSCRCLQKELLSALTITHGQAGKPGIRSSEYSIWSEMKARCYRKTCKSYPRYGGRGIKVCDRWLESFESFFADMGKRPSLEYTLERDDNNGHYEPNNCRWATRIEQANNTRTNTYFIWEGQRKTISQWARYWSITPSKMYTLIQKHVIKRDLHEQLNLKPSTTVSPGE